MHRIRPVKSFLIGMGICLGLISMVHTAWAGCEQKTTITPSGGYPTTFYGGSRSAPISLSPGGDLGATCGSGYDAGGYYTAVPQSYSGIMAGSFSWTNCGTANPISSDPKWNNAVLFTNNLTTNYDICID